MKKLWVMALGTAFLLQTASLYAVDFKFEGEARVRGIYADDLDANEDAEDQQAFADGRFRLRSTATTGITALVLAVDLTNSFNDPTNPACPDAGGGSADSCATGNYRFGSANFGNSYNIFGVREAYLRLDLNMVKLAFGRKPFRLGHSLVLDDTMDAVVGKFMVGGFEVMLANGKLLESNAGGATGRTGSDTDLYIAKTGFTHGDMHNVGVFVTYLNDRDRQFLGAAIPVPGVLPGLGGDATLWGAGVTLDGKFGAINVGAEFDYFTGEISNGTTADLQGWNALVGVGLNVGAIDVGVTGLYTTGQETGDEINVNGLSGNFVLGNILVNDNINSDREGQCASVTAPATPGRLGSGGRGCVGGFGVTGIKVSAGFEVMKGHTEVAAIWAQTTEDPVVGGVTGDSDLGIEIDLNHRQKLDDNVAVNVNLGYLLSGDAWETLTGGDDNQAKGIISLNYMF